MELVSAWNDDSSVYLVERLGESVRGHRLPAKWSAYVQGLDESDRGRLARVKGVQGLRVEAGYTRVDFADRWSRRHLVEEVLQPAVEKRGFGAVLEADVSPLRRLLSDNPHLEVASAPRLGYFDLEADPRRGFEPLVEGKARVLVWHLRDAAGVTRDTGVLQEDSDAAEAEFLAAFFLAAEKYDVLLAWNGDSFDFQVLRNRSHKLRVKLRGKAVCFHRWCWLDQMLCLKKYNQAHESGDERASLALDAVAKHHLGVGKADYDARRCWDDWAAGGEARARLVAYCERDVELMPRIEEKTGFVSLHLAVCRVTRCLPDTASLSAVQQGDGFLLRLGAEHGYHFPTRHFDEEEEEQFVGAYVMEPRRIGILEEVGVCDFAGLYPSIIRTWNMSLDTLVEGGDVSGVHGYCRLPAKRTHFRTDRRGMFPRALDALVEQRSAYTAKADAAEPGSPEANFYKRLSSAFKIVNNSMYGIIGSAFTRFFNVEVAEGVTSTGAWLIKEVVVPAMARAGGAAEYGDTDSSMVTGLSHDAFGRVVAELNESWPRRCLEYGCPTSYVKLESEKRYSRMVLLGKKRYAARLSYWKGKPVGDDKKLEVKGLEYKRGDTLSMTRKFQAEVLALLLRPGPVPGVEELVVVVEKWRRRVLAESLELEDVVLSQSVKDLDEYKVRYTSPRCGAGKKGKACGHDFGDVAAGPGRATKCPRCGTERRVVKQPAHVRLARVMEARGESVTPGTRVRYLFVRPESGAEVEDGVQPALADDEGVLGRVDRDYYWDKKVYPATERVLEACFPQRDWRDSAARRRKAAGVEAAAARATRVDDLPLFVVRQGAGVVPEATQQEIRRVGDVAPIASRVIGRRRRAAPAAFAEVELQVDGARPQSEVEAVCTSVAEVARAHPGGARVVVVLDLGEHLVRVPTATRVAGTAAALAALGALAGVSVGGTK